MSKQPFRTYGLFDDQENTISAQLFSSYSEEFTCILQGLELLNKMLNSLNGKIKNTDRRDVTILNFQAQNLKFLNKCYLELTRGYIRIPSALLKTVIEQLMLSLVFAEFPEKEEEYDVKKHRAFLRTEGNNWTQLLAKVSTNGTIFNNTEKPNFWDDILNKEQYVLLNTLAHANSDSIAVIMFDEATQKYFKGPRIPDEDLLKALARGILLSLIFSITILNKYFEVYLTEDDHILISKMIQIINRIPAERILS